MGSFMSFSGTWNEFFQAFIKGELYYGSYMEHASEWWKHRSDTNVLFIWYEELLKNRAESIKKIAEFLGYKLSEEIIEILFQKTSLDEMKKDENAKIAQRLRLPTSSFFRAGTNNSWKELFTEEQVKQMDALLLSYTCNFNMDFN
uniref:Sulfotransferase domain-containing protein n=1 Tax=Acrobeloides nanus TaxID=290746 RepID=A0A914DVS7_9BILA